jgi:hypothetical protein
MDLVVFEYLYGGFDALPIGKKKLPETSACGDNAA